MCTIVTIPRNVQRAGSRSYTFIPETFPIQKSRVQMIQYAADNASRYNLRHIVHELFYSHPVGRAEVEHSEYSPFIGLVYARAYNIQNSKFLRRYNYFRRDYT